MRHNIVVIGECGTGKSTLVQSMTGAGIGIHNNVTKGTSKAKDYVVTMQENEFKIWDTPGLNEGSQGTNTKAEAYVKKLVGKLKKSEGVHLLVFCTRGRTTRVLKGFYTTFFQEICGGTVPAVLVVTHLDREEDREGWWERNQAAFMGMGMVFRGHACVSDKLGSNLKGILHSLILQHFDPEQKAGAKEKKGGGGSSCIIS